MDGTVPDDKKSVRLTVFNQTFNLRVSGDPADALQAASEVDQLMTAISRSGNMDSTRVGILACLHLQDRVHALEAELARLRAIEERARELTRLLDDVVSPRDVK